MTTATLATDPAGGSDTEVHQGWPGARTGVIAYLVLLLALPQQLIVGPLGFAGSPATIWGLVCCLWWVLFHLNRVHSVGEPRLLRWAAVGFLAAVLLSYTNAMTHPMAGDELSVADAGVLRVISWLGVMLLAAEGLRGLDDWWRVLEWVVGLCAILALLGVVQALTDRTWVDQLSVPGLSVNAPIGLTDAREGHPRPVGTATHAIEFGQILTMGLVLSLAMTMVRGATALRVAAGLCAVASLLVVSRSAVLSIVVAFAVLVSLLTSRQRIGAAIAGVFVLVTAYLLRPGLLGTLGRAFTGIEGDASARSRTDSYSYAFDAFSASPFIGKGFATFLPKYRILDNQWLLSVIEIGVVGVLSLLLLMAAVVSAGFRAERSLIERKDRVMTRACTASVVAVCVGMLFYDGFAFAQATGMLFVISGLTAASFRLSRTTNEPYAVVAQPRSQSWAARARRMSARASRT